MSSVNIMTIVGNLGGEPELKTLESGKQVCNFSIAVNDRERRGDEWVDVTTWFKVAVWGKKAEACGKYLKKGAMVFVQGPISIEQWTDRENNPQVTLKIMSFNCEFLSGWKSNDEANNPTSAADDMPVELRKW